MGDPLTFPIPLNPEKIELAHSRGFKAVDKVKTHKNIND